MATMERSAEPRVEPSPARSTGAGGEPGGRWISIAAWVAVAIGVAMQVLHFSGGKPLWLDEAMVGLNIRHLSVRELMGPLDYDQVAPIGWLLLEKLLYGLPIPPEYSLRILALATGVGGLLIFRTLAFRALGGLAALAAVVMYALSPAILRYASEVKPYGVDAFVAVGLLWIGYELLQRERSPWLLLGALWLGGLASVTVSFPVVYIMATVGLLVFLKRAMQRQWVEAGTLAVIGATWLAAFAFLYLTIYQPQAASSTVTEGAGASFFDNYAFAPLPPRSLHDVIWFGGWAQRTIEFFFGENARFGIVIAVAAGLIGFALRRSWAGALIILPPVLAVLASAFHTYPVYDRLLLFLAPNLLLLIGYGIGVVAARARPAIVPWAILLAMCVTGGIPYIQGNLRAQPQFSINNIYPLLDTLKAQRKPGDVLYVSNEAIPAWLFYKARYGLSDMPWIAGDATDVVWPCFIQDFTHYRTQGRVWVMILSVAERDPPVEDSIQIALGARNLKSDVKLAATGWNMWLYSLDLSPMDPDFSPASLPEAPVRKCSPDVNANRFDPPARAGVRAK